MMNALTVRAIRDESARAFARWDPAVFDAIVSGPASVLAERLGQEADTALGGYLRLVQQGVGRGLVKHATAVPSGWSSFLERLVVELIPERLPEIAPDRRLRILRRTDSAYPKQSPRDQDRDR